MKTWMFPFAFFYFLVCTQSDSLWANILLKISNGKGSWEMWKTKNCFPFLCLYKKAFKRILRKIKRSIHVLLSSHSFFCATFFVIDKNHYQSPCNGKINKQTVFIFFFHRKTNWFWLYIDTLWDKYNRNNPKAPNKCNTSHFNWKYITRVCVCVFFFKLLHMLLHHFTFPLTAFQFKSGKSSYLPSELYKCWKKRTCWK